MMLYRIYSSTSHSLHMNSGPLAASTRLSFDPLAQSIKRPSYEYIDPASAQFGLGLTSAHQPEQLFSVSREDVDPVSEQLGPGRASPLQPTLPGLLPQPRVDRASQPREGLIPQLGPRALSAGPSLGRVKRGRKLKLQEARLSTLVRRSSRIAHKSTKSSLESASKRKAVRNEGLIVPQAAPDMAAHPPSIMGSIIVKTRSALQTTLLQDIEALGFDSKGNEERVIRALGTVAARLVGLPFYVVHRRVELDQTAIASSLKDFYIGLLGREIKPIKWDSLYGPPSVNISSLDDPFSMTEVATIADSQPHMSPLLVRGSLDGPHRNASGNRSWRTSGITGRSISGPLSPMHPEASMVAPTTGRSGQLLPALMNISGMSLSGPLMNIRGSTGNLRSRHVSRDSGDCLIDTPNSGEDILHPGSSVLQGINAPLILLAEIAYENDEDFHEHLPLLFHVTFVSMDSSEDIVLLHSQYLLVNLLYSLAGRHLELYEVESSDGENKQKVFSLIKYIQSKRGSLMWENEDPTLVRTELPSTALLSALVLSTVDAIFFQGDLRETWGAEALKWATECTSRHLACRSHQIYRALCPTVKSENCVILFRCLRKCLGNPVPAVLGFAMEILLTLQVMVENMEPEKVILYPQLFWGCVAIMHTDFVYIYCQVLELFSRVIDRLSFRDQTTENVLLSSTPRDEFDTFNYDAPELQRDESRSGRESLPSESGKVIA
ncbi:hypothetical protein Cni_G14065 [Canna indica]|uniref:Uncharacterized protein n=1 Tax=Canna indica TaxID=4628 RepID=A0AAQ3KBG2_9LILI|nr:hypothetical protein Cni_G14065 [Canna indica]